MTIFSRKAYASLIAAACLMICLFHNPELPHIDLAPAFEKAHPQEIIETDQFIKEIEENNFIYIHDKRRNLVKLVFSPN